VAKEADVLITSRVPVGVAQGIYQYNLGGIDGSAAEGLLLQTAPNLTADEVQEAVQLCKGVPLLIRRVGDALRSGQIIIEVSGPPGLQPFSIAGIHGNQNCSKVSPPGGISAWAQDGPCFKSYRIVATIGWVQPRTSLLCTGGRGYAIRDLLGSAQGAGGTLSGTSSALHRR